MATYLDELMRAMAMLGELPNSIFIGQNLRFGGTSQYHTIKHISEEKRIELPVAEEMQMGMSIGLSLVGYLPITIYPRWDFLILALNQLINHADKAKEMSSGQFNLKIIVRVCVGSVKPMMPGLQHCQNYTEAIKKMVTNIEVRELLNADEVYSTYEEAMNSDKSYIIVEHSDLYNKDFAFKDIKESKEK